MTFNLSSIVLINNEIMNNVDKQMMIENFPKLKGRDRSPNRDEFIDVSLDPHYFLLDSPFNVPFSEFVMNGSNIRLQDLRTTLPCCIALPCCLDM
jgi:hypothetical protein